MLTSFFSKSKPVNFLVVGLWMTFSYVFVNYIGANQLVTWSYFFKKTGLLVIYLVLMFLINFVVKRNEVTKQNTYTIILFALFTISLSPILKDGATLLSALFVLLALRRTMSLQNLRNRKKKIFDATFWIGCAILSHPSSWPFLGVIFLGILIYASEDFKNWLIPFFGLFAVYVIALCYNLLVSDIFFNPITYFQQPSVQFDIYREIIFLVPLSVLITFSLWVLFYNFGYISKAPKKLKYSLYLLLFIFITASFCVFFSSDKTGAELLFFIIPVCIMGANYFQQEGEKWLKEVLLLTLVVITLVFPFLSF